jgi:Icc-related predicted phosphoesterase
MKILAIGDFHGKFPSGLRRKIKKEKPDLIVSPGDFFPWSLKGKFFQEVYGKNIELWEMVGKKKFKDNLKKDLRQGEEKVIKKLSLLGIPTFVVIGNYDNANVNDQYTKKNGQVNGGGLIRIFSLALLKNIRTLKDLITHI